MLLMLSLARYDAFNSNTNNGEGVKKYLPDSFQVRVGQISLDRMPLVLKPLEYYPVAFVVI